MEAGTCGFSATRFNTRSARNWSTFGKVESCALIALFISSSMLCLVPRSRTSQQYRGGVIQPPRHRFKFLSAPFSCQTIQDSLVFLRAHDTPGESQERAGAG